MLAACGQEIELDSNLFGIEPQVVIKSTNFSNDARLIRVGEIHTLSVDFNFPMNGDVEWSTSSDCVTLIPIAESEWTTNGTRTYARTCDMYAVSQGTAYVKARVGEHEDTIIVKVNAPLYVPTIK